MDFLKNLQGYILGICSVSGGIATIYAAYVNETDELTHVFVDGEEIIATPSHPFYCPTKGWTDASHLRAGDILVLVNGEYVVVEKVQHELLERPVKVYNFQVEDYHTYYVASGVLVHNSCYNPKTNATRAARLSNGSTAYLQENGEYAGKLVAKDFAQHGNSAFKLFELVGNKSARLVGDLAANGVRILAKHSSNAGKVYEIIRWLEIK